MEIKGKSNIMKEKRRNVFYMGYIKKKVLGKGGSEGVFGTLERGMWMKNVFPFLFFME